MSLSPKYYFIQWCHFAIGRWIAQWEPFDMEDSRAMYRVARRVDQTGSALDLLDCAAS